MRMQYKGGPQDTALAKLVLIVSERLKTEGLGEARFQAFGVTAAGCEIAVNTQLDVPESYTPGQRISAQVIAGEECAKFIRERYGHIA